MSASLTDSVQLAEDVDEARSQNWVSSRYNFSVPVDDAVVLYNAASGAVLLWRGEDAVKFASALCGAVFELAHGILQPELERQLVEGKFIVPSGTDELLVIRDRFKRARGHTPLVLTITTTMDCNLGCFYCYEERSMHQLESNDIPTLVELTRHRLREHPTKTLHVDWYGGEPLLNQSFIELASPALQAMCAEEKAVYHASMISNGTVWPEDVGAFIAKHRIRQVQLSFDGMRENHNRRRRFRSGRAPSADASSFDLIVTLVDCLLDHVRTDLRFNMDHKNKGDLLPFVEMAKTRGWFNKPFKAVVQPARLASYTDKSSFLRTGEIAQEDFDSLRASLVAYAGPDVRVEESEAPGGFPYPRTSVCAALAQRSDVIGADGLVYRCGLQVGEQNRAVGSIRLTRAQSFPDADWWAGFDPTTLPNCSRCSFLPVCWGGCPKKHLDGDRHALEEQSIYWRNNLPRLITGRFGMLPPTEFTYSEEDQFR